MITLLIGDPTNWGPKQLDMDCQLVPRVVTNWKPSGSCQLVIYYLTNWGLIGLPISLIKFRVLTIGKPLKIKSNLK